MASNKNACHWKSAETQHSKLSNEKALFKAKEERGVGATSEGRHQEQSILVSHRLLRRGVTQENPPARNQESALEPRIMPRLTDTTWALQLNLSCSNPRSAANCVPLARILNFPEFLFLVCKLRIIPSPTCMKGLNEVKGWHTADLR